MAARCCISALSTWTILVTRIEFGNTASGFDYFGFDDFTIAVRQQVVSADLSITKSDNPDPVIAGNILTYTITVNTVGPDTAEDVVVTDTLPAGVTFVSTSGCNNDPNGVPTCSLGDIVAGGFAQYTITVTVNAGTTGTFSNVSTVDSDTDDPDLDNNTATEDTSIFVPGPGPVPAPAIQDWRLLTVFVFLMGLALFLTVRRSRTE